MNWSVGSLDLSFIFQDRQRDPNQDIRPLLSFISLTVFSRRIFFLGNFLTGLATANGLAVLPALLVERTWTVCTKSGPVGFAFCALMIGECFWGTNPKIFRTNHAYAIGVIRKGAGRASVYRTVPSCTEKQGCKHCDCGQPAGLRLFRIFADGWKTMSSIFTNNIVSKRLRADR
jgi:hypothetical protein